jgi:hypothetical protein
MLREGEDLHNQRRDGLIKNNFSGGTIGRRHLLSEEEEEEEEV